MKLKLLSKKNEPLYFSAKLKGKISFKNYDHLLYKDAQILKKIHNKKSDYIYLLASKLPKMVDGWIKDTSITHLRYHLNKLIQKEKVPYGLNTLRQAYYIGKCFADLVHDPSRRVLSPSQYREIAGAEIKDNPEVEKPKLRKEAEAGEYTVTKIRNILHEKYKLGRKDSIEKRFTFSLPVSAFAKKVGQYIKEHKEITAGTEIRLIATFPKKKIFKNRKREVIYFKGS